MRFLANENFPGMAVDALRTRGHDVAWIRAISPGAKDMEILARAADEHRILLTFDKDFGELAFHQGLPASSGIVLFRIPTHTPSYVAQRAVIVLESRSDWSGNFSVIEERRLRMTALPPGGQAKP